jgi:hypothetical protein
MRFRWMVVVTALVACGGNGDKLPGDGGLPETGGGAADAGDCLASTLTASGAFAGTRSAPVPYARGSVDLSSVMVVAQVGAPFIAYWDFAFPGAPGLTTYTEATSGAICTATLADSVEATRAWTASKGVQDVPDRGTCRLTLTSVTPTLDLGGSMEYCVHGTMTATLPADLRTLATGTVTLSASF